MHQPLLLNGHTGAVDNRDALIEQLEQEVTGLRQELRGAQAALGQAQKASARAVTALRQQLSPLYRALQALFGEMEAIGGDTPDAGAPMNDRSRSVWESWKSRLGGGAAKVIDALLLHGELNTQQLAIAVGMHRTSIPKIIYTLNKAGLLNKNGGKFSLKQL